MFERFLLLGSGEVIARALYLLAFVAMARGLGKSALGEFSIAVSISSYLVLFVQQGFDQIAVRETARDRRPLATYVRGLLGLRLLLACGVYSFLLIYTQVEHLHEIRRAVLLIVCSTCISAAITPRWAFQTIAPLKYACAGILSQAVFVAGAVLVWRGAGIYTAAVAYGLGEMAAAVYSLYAIQPDCAITPAYVPKFWRQLVVTSWPLSQSALLGIVIYNFDILALGWLRSPADTGLYIACYRCATVFSPMLSVLQLSILPSFATAYPDRERMRRGIVTVVVPSIAIALLVAFVLAMVPGAVLRVLYGNGYSSGAEILRWLAWSLPVQAVRSVLRQVLLAAHLQRQDAMNMLLAAITCVVLDLALIPRLGPVACAVSTLSSEIVLLVSSATVLKFKVFSNTASVRL